jgi:hypothetical protein
VTTPDDARAGLRAILNQIPATMEASQVMLSALAGILPVKGEDGDISLDTLRQLYAKLAATVTLCVVTIDNRIARLEGRQGLTDSTWEGIMSEFRMGG